VVLRFDDGEDVRELASAPEAPRLSEIGPATPDHTIYSKRLPCYVPLDDPASPAAVVDAVRAAVDRFVETYTTYFEAHRHGELMRPSSGAPGPPAGAGGPPQLADPYPRVLLLPGLGMFTSGKDTRTAGIVADIYHHTAWVMRAASALGPYTSLSAQDAFNIEFWPLEWSPTWTPTALVESPRRSRRPPGLRVRLGSGWT
jgi:rhamnose utilization protein RhaD (predicted bifunctional aldolase and dehydrogenase)